MPAAAPGDAVVAGTGRRRVAVVDALRGVALVGVVVINGVGYAHLPDTLWVVPPPVPGESTSAWLTQVLLIGLLQGKAYPMLAFLFGVGIALSMRSRRHAELRGEQAMPHQRRRLWKLLGLGVLHGAVLYSGDVLTIYALLGFWLLRWARLPARAVLRRLLWVMAVALVFAVLEAWALAALAHDPLAWGVVPEGYSSVADWPGHASLSATGYLTALSGLPFVAPQLLALMTAGLLAGRLGVFSRARWQPMLRRLARWALPLGLVANLAIALVLVQPGASPMSSPGPWAAALLVAGPLLSVGIAAWVATRSPAVLQPWARIGRWSLTVYLASSLVFALQFSGAGLGWGTAASSVSLAALSAGTCGLLMVLALSLSRWRSSGPLERWLSR